MPLSAATECNQYCLSDVAYTTEQQIHLKCHLFKYFPNLCISKFSFYFSEHFLDICELEHNTSASTHTHTQTCAHRYTDQNGMSIVLSWQMAEGHSLWLSIIVLKIKVYHSKHANLHAFQHCWHSREECGLEKRWAKSSSGSLLSSTCSSSI